MIIRVYSLTVSDKGSRGEREDKTGPAVCARLAQETGEVTYTVESGLLPDEREEIAARLRAVCDSGSFDLVLTNGGTGFSPRDWTPEATKDVCERMAPGIPEAMRAYSMRITPRAMLSRQEAGIRARTLIVNLPGSPKAAVENLEAILPALSHGIEVLRGEAGDCAAPPKR